MYFTFPQFKKFPIKLLFRKFSENFLLEKLQNIFPNYHIIFTDSGRSAFQLAIESLGLQNTEMILPAYLCDIFKPILKHYDIKPIHIDTNLETFQMELSEIDSQITPNTKSILISHTYGLPVDMEQVSRIARNYNLKIIEDCAHIAPPDSPEKFGDALFFSFAKLFPVISGGMLVSKENINIKLEKTKITFRSVIKFLRLFPSLANLSEIFRPEEKLIENQRSVPKKPLKIYLNITDYCLERLPEKIIQRIKIASYFQKQLQKLNFKVQTSENNNFTILSALVPESADRDKLFYGLRKRGIFCARIWRNPLLKQLPNTSLISKQIINFPLQYWYKEKDVDKIIFYILKELDSKV